MENTEECASALAAELLEHCEENEADETTGKLRKITLALGGGDL